MLLANLTNDSRIGNASGRVQPALQGLNDMEYILIFIACCIFVVNLYVISLFIRNRLLRRNSNRLLLSLALSDMVTGLVTVPLLVATTPLRQLGFEKYKLVFIMADVMTVLSASLIILNLCAITGERYLRLCHPMTHVTILTDRRIIIAIVVIWLIALIYSLFPFAWLHHVFDENATEAMLEMVHSSDAKYSIAGAFIFIIPVFALIGAFSRMFYAIHQLGVSERNTTLTAKQSVQRKRENKAITIFGVMFTVFLICWAPWIILRPILSEHPKMFMSIPPLLLNILMLIRFLTSVINPLLYTMHKYDFNRALQEDKRKLVAFLQCREYIDLRRGSLTATGSNYRPYSSKQVVGYSSKDIGTLDREKDPKTSPTEHGQYLQVPNGSHNHSNGSFGRPRAGTREEYLLDSLADPEERRCFNEGDVTPVKGINCSCRHPEKLVSKALLSTSCYMGDDCDGRNDDLCDAKNVIHNGNLRRPRAGTREEFLPDSLADPEERRCFNEGDVTPVKEMNCSCRHPEKLVSKALLSPSCDMGDACYARNDDQSSHDVVKSRSPSVKRVSFNNSSVEHAKQESLDSDPLIAEASNNSEVTSADTDAETDQQKCVDGNGFSSFKRDVTESGGEHKSQCEGVTDDNSTTKQRNPRKSPCLNDNLDSHGIAVQQSVTPRPSIFKTSFLQKIFNTQDRHTIKSNAAKAGSGADELPSVSHETATGSVYSGQSFNSRRDNHIGDIQPRPNGDEMKVLLARDGDHTDEIVTILSKKAEKSNDDDNNQHTPPSQTAKTDLTTKAAVCEKTIGTDGFEVVVKYDSKSFKEINFSAWI